MTFWRLVLQSLGHDAKISGATLCGVAIATAVILGALVLGDSVTLSLRARALERLDGVEYVLIAPRFFSFSEPENSLADSVQGVIILSAVVESQSQQSAAVELIALPKISEGAIVSDSLAERLALRVGDEVRLRIEVPSLIPREQAFGHRDETLFRAPLKLAAIGTQKFSLQSGQQTPQTIYVSLNWLQRRLALGNKVNAILSSKSADKYLRDSSFRRRGTCDNLGITLTFREDEFGDEIFFASQKFLFSPKEADAIRMLSVQETQSTRDIFINLAEEISCGERAIFYSTLCAIESKSDNESADEPIADDEIVLNSWAAEDLGAQVGDTISVTYFLPESFHGKTETRTASFRLARIAPMEGIYAARDLIPPLAGVSDAASIADWNPPFPFDAKKITARDEAYWDEFRAAPKGFISLKTARQLWQNRFGDTSIIAVRFSEKNFPIFSVHVAHDFFSTHVTPDSDLYASMDDWFFVNLQMEFGLTWIPIRENVLRAASGTTPFGMLFLALSMFLLFSATMLIALLFQLLRERRAREMRLLASLGFSPRRIRERLLAEGILLASGGSLLGIPLGIAYASLMIYGLHTWWRDAIIVPFVTLHLTCFALGIGAVAGVVIATLVLFLITRDSPIAGGMKR